MASAVRNAAFICHRPTSMLAGIATPAITAAASAAIPSESMLVMVPQPEVRGRTPLAAPPAYGRRDDKPGSTRSSSSGGTGEVDVLERHASLVPVAGCPSGNRRHF
ncbi:hypothetical protein Slala04_23140 [Streptomyces lavendulae subsp. lavendulae]|nr:hypothetical protein Slala04_23140 [Streptomyces lavendulae subsp. lavendulae]